jgi:hypothetical protein
VSLGPQQEAPVSAVNRVRESLTFARDKNFEREAVVDERALIRDGLRRGMGDVTYPQLRAHLDSRLTSGEFQLVERTHGDPEQKRFFFIDESSLASTHQMREFLARLDRRRTRCGGW